MSSSLRIIFAGTPNFAAHHLDMLIHTNYNIIGVFTKPDRPAGRGNRLMSSPVKKVAEKYNLPIFQPISLSKAKDYQNILTLKADIMIVVAYGLILPQIVLKMPRFGCINVHNSLLPRWRGAAPIQRALCAGDKQTGVTIIQMDTGLDTGAILYKVTCDICSSDTSATLCNKLLKISTKALLIVLAQITSGNTTIESQNSIFATYAKKISKEEARLDWRLPAVQLARYIRAFNPWPYSYFVLKNQPIKVWKANVSTSTHVSLVPGTIWDANKLGLHIVTGDGILILTTLQLTGRKAVTVSNLLNSRQEWFIPGTILD